MTVPGGDSGERAQDAADQGPSEGTYEAPPIEQTQAQPNYETPPPGYAAPGYEAPLSYPPPAGYPPPPSYQAPGYTGSSYTPTPPPQYGQPSPYAGGYGQAPSGTNTLAIASLVASCIGVLCGIGSIVGIVLGAVALNQIKQTRQGGYGLAVAGIVVGVASLVINLIWATYALR